MYDEHDRKQIMSWLEGLTYDDWRENHSDSEVQAIAQDALALLKEQEIVRCKDCKHYRYYGLSNETVSECTIDHCENPDGNWFCADGECEET